MKEKQYITRYSDALLVFREIRATGMSVQRGEMYSSYTAYGLELCSTTSYCSRSGLRYSPIEEHKAPRLPSLVVQVFLARLPY